MSTIAITVVASNRLSPGVDVSDGMTNNMTYYLVLAAILFAVIFCSGVYVGYQIGSAEPEDE